MVAGFRGVSRRWPRPARWASYAAGALALVLIAATVTGVIVVRRPWPQTDGTAPLPGLQADVTVSRDAYGIPRLSGDSVGDLMRAQGYVTAQDRFFQLDVQRHVASGRLAELIGPAGLPNDRLTRTLGLRRVAEQELGLLDPATRVALESYAAGVNAYLDQRSPSQLALEYTVLGLGGLDYRPEDWDPVDSVVWLKALAWDLHGNTVEEIDRTLTAEAVGSARTAELYPAVSAGRDPIVAQGAVVDQVFEQDATSPGTRDPKRPPPFGTGRIRALEHVRRALADPSPWLGRGDGLGSNSWVLDAAHSATGKPLLADDPHLGLGLPGAFAQVGLHCRTTSADCPLDVSGFALAGVPGVLIGHNADLAWGLTNLQADTADLFLERLRGDSASDGDSDSDGASESLTDESRGSYEPVRSRTETIEVEGQEDVSLTIRSTAHGPLLSDVDADVASTEEAGGEAGSDTGDDTAVALQWTGLQPGTTADAILGLDLANGWDDVRAAAAEVSSPPLSLVYADAHDAEGHIGYQAAGRVPIRKSGNDGRTPARGWAPEDDWTGQDVPFEALPSVLDPDQGFVVAANQPVVDGDYPYFLTDDWDHGDRAQRIREVLTGTSTDVLTSPATTTVGEAADLQLDTRHPFATVLLPYLLEARLPAGYYSDGQRLLRDWDLTQPAGATRDGAAAAYFDVVWRNLLALTFHDELPESVWPDGGQRWYAVVTRLLREPDSTWWDDLATDGETERRDDVVRQAMLDARDELTRREGLDTDDWSWGRLHAVSLRSPVSVEGGQGLLRRLDQRDGWEVGGGSGAVDATSWDAADGYDVTTAPALRMVVSAGDWDDSRWIDLTGASGHPFHPHRTDQTDLWADGRTLPWAFTADAVAAATEDTLTLEPDD